MNKVGIGIIGMLTATQAMAGSYIKFGSGALTQDIAETRVIEVGYKHRLGFLLDYELGLGYYADRRSDLGRKSSVYSTASLGLDVKTGGVYIEAFGGLALISNPDSLLGGTFPQFTESLNIGLYDNRDVKIGFGYRHISSAGIFSPNMGRDFITINLEIPY